MSRKAESGRTQRVVHPLFDKAERKLDPERVGPMHMTPVVKYSLFALRLYLILMILLAFYRVLQLAGVFKMISR
jgi:hypothetical protein